MMPKCGADKKKSPQNSDNVISQRSIIFMKYYIQCYFPSPTQQFAENAVTNYHRVDGSSQQIVTLSQLWMGQVPIQSSLGAPGKPPFLACLFQLLAAAMVLVGLWQHHFDLSFCLCVAFSSCFCYRQLALCVSHKDPWKQLLKLAMAFWVHLNNPE